MEADVALVLLFANPSASGSESAIVGDVNSGPERSTIADGLRDSLIPGLRALLGPLLPADVRAAG